MRQQVDNETLALAMLRSERWNEGLTCNGDKVMHRDYVTERERGNAIGYITIFAIAGFIMSMTSGCMNYRVRAELAGEEIDTHTETVSVKKSMPYLCNWYQFADCPKLPEK